MYILERSRYRANRRNGRWKETNMTNEAISTLSANYGEIYLYISYPFQNDRITKALYWENVQNQINSLPPTMTVQEWLTSLGNKTLPFDNELPSEKVRLVRYAQAWHAGYNFTPVGVQDHPNSDISTFYKDDLLLTHPQHKPETICKKTLITVNSYFHICDYTDNGTRIVDGNKTIRKCNDNQIGIYSFETIGDIKYVPITEDMISGLNKTSPLWDGSYLTLPSDIDIKDKTVLLVTGGYLNILSSVYNRVGDRTWRVQFGNMMFLDRYIESVRSIDLSSLNLTIDPENKTLFNVNELKNDSVIKAYLTLSQSFFVIVDSPSFFQEYQQLEYLNLPGRFIHDTYDRLPLVGAYGNMIDYHVIREPGRKNILPEHEQSFVYCGTQNRRYDYDANHRAWPNGNLVDGGRYPAAPGRHDTAFFRIMGIEG